jgi:hypothetical protein
LQGSACSSQDPTSSSTIASRAFLIDAARSVAAASTAGGAAGYRERFASLRMVK